MGNKLQTLITDSGSKVELTNDDGVVMVVQRYGVWQNMHWSGKMVVVEVSGDLGAMLAKYGVERDAVVPLTQAPRVRG